MTVSSLVARGGATHSTVELSDGNRVQTVLCERPDERTTYAPSLTATLDKVAGQREALTPPPSDFPCYHYQNVGEPHRT